MIARTLAAIVAAAALLLGGCASTAPAYSPAVGNIDVAARLPGSVAVGKFEFAKGEESTLNAIGARASSFASPVNNSYADYIAEALKSELRSAGKLDPASPRVLTGVVEKNRLSAGGINTNDAEVGVRFRLTDGTAARFDKSVAAQHEWESSFMGGIAIPRAIQNYVVTIQMLLKKLYTDPEFAAATAAR